MREPLQAYLDLGWSIFPIAPRTKQPLVKWEAFQHRQPSIQEVEAWDAQWPDCNWALATGAQSGVIALDSDSEPRPNISTLINITARGQQYLLKHPDSTIPNRTKLDLGDCLVDVRGDGGYILIPPSIHPTGVPYVWAGDGILRSLAEVPLSILKILLRPDPADQKWTDILQGVPTGNRNDTAARVAGKLFSMIHPDWWEVGVWGGLQAWNQRNEEPLPLTDRTGEPGLRTIFESIRKKEAAKHQPIRHPTSIVYTAAELEAMTIPPTRYIINPILPEGVNLFPAKSKVGKSVIARNLSLLVATGASWWAGMRLSSLASNITLATEQGRVLYASLDVQNLEQIRAEWRTMHGGPIDGLPIHLATSLPRINEGGLEALDTFLIAHPDTALIIVDMWNNFRPARKGRTYDLHEEDYDSLRLLQDFALEHHIAVLVLHQSRKAVGDDFFDNIAGTSAENHAATTTWYFKRHRDEVTGILQVGGRGVGLAGSLDLALQADPATFWWRPVGDAGRVRMREERREVAQVLETEGQPLSPSDVALRLGKSSANVKQLLWKMLRDGEAATDGKGRYRLSR